jgi:methylglutaconyl-CoA hydratase
MTAVRVARENEVLRVTLARPEARNACDAALLAEVAQAFGDVGDARVVVLAGDGPTFCSGADIEWMRGAADLDLEANVSDAHLLPRAMAAIDACPAPVIAVVQGHALGGGAGFVACSDIAIAHESTQFGFTEVKLGIVPGGLAPFVLRKIGESAARRYFLTGERFDAAAALRVGLVHEVTSDLDATLAQVLAELLGAGPIAVREAKRVIRDRPDPDESARIIAERRASPEGQEGLRAFLASTKENPVHPSWRRDLSDQRSQ